MAWIGVAFFVGFVSYLLWAATGSLVSALLRDGWPEAYVQAGRPTSADFWWRRTFPNAFDQFTLTRRFRKVAISNRDVLLQLELACWLRWVQVLAFVAFVILLLGSIGGRVAP